MGFLTANLFWILLIGGGLWLFLRHRRGSGSGGGGCGGGGYSDPRHDELPSGWGQQGGPVAPGRAGRPAEAPPRRGGC